MLLGLTLGCGGGEGPVTPDPDPEVVDTAVTVPPRGTPNTFDVVTWNIQMFGAEDGGPSDDLRQLRRARDVILGTDADLWAVQEIADATDFAALLAQLPGYTGLLANDPAVENGPDFYDDFNGTELKVGLIYRADAVEVLSARVVLTDFDFHFAGRPPLEVQLRIRSAGVTREVVGLVLHAKAGSDGEAWERRVAAGQALADYLTATWPDRPVMVLGDWNDDVDESITQGRDTPYRPFVASAPLWTFVTEALSAAGQTTILGYEDPIDHILVSDEVWAWYEGGSAEAYRVDALVPDYRTTTSDHLPVVARFVVN